MKQHDTTIDAIVGMIVLAAVVLAMVFLASGCASGSQTVTGPDGWRWNSSWSALGGASIQKSAQDFDGELIAEEDSLAIKLNAGQRVEGAMSPEVKAEMVAAILKFLAAP